MTRDVQIVILDDLDNVLGTLDLIDSSDFGLKLTKTLASLTDISKRSASYSLDFEAPNSLNNNRLLFGASNINAYGHSRDVLGQRKCYILVDGNQIDTGFIYCHESTFEENYKLNFKGGNNSWLELIGDTELNELTWRDYITDNYDVDAFEYFDSSRIGVLEVAGYSDNYDLTYAVVNRNNLVFQEFYRPLIRWYAFWRAVERLTGYTFTGDIIYSDFMTGAASGINYTDNFGNTLTHQGLVLDVPFRFTIDDSDINASLIAYSVPESQIAIYYPTFYDTPSDKTVIGNVGADSVSDVQRRFSAFWGFFDTEIQDDGLLFDKSKSEYTVLVTGVYVIDFKLRYLIETFIDSSNQWFRGYDQAKTVPPNIQWHIVKNNTQEHSIDGTILFTGVASPQFRYDTPLQVINFPAVDIYGTYLTDAVPFFNLSAGDKITIMVEMLTDAVSNDINYQFYQTFADKYWRFRIWDGSSINIQLKNTVTLGSPFRINSHIPKDLKVIDIIKDFKNMFNLYFEADAKRKTVYVQTRDEFFRPLSEATDYTDKLDLSENPVINLQTSYKKSLVFNFKSDSTNKFLKRWEKLYRRNYGEYTHKMNNANRFDVGTSTLALGTFATSIQGRTQDRLAVTTVIKPEYNDAKNATEPLLDEYSPMLLVLIRGQQFDNNNQPVYFANNIHYPVNVAVAETFGNTVVYQDRRILFNGLNGFVDSYYLKTLASIEDFAEVECKINMTLYEFMNLDLKKPIYLSAPEQLKGYYLIEKVSNYDFIKERSVTCTLQKFKDYVGVSFDQTQGTNIKSTITLVDDAPKALLYDINGLLIEVVDNNGNKIYNI